MSQDRCAANRLVRLAGLAFACALAVVADVASALAEVALLRPVRDGTLVEDPFGTLANGSGDALFSGRINATSRSVRRALLAFDVASAVPAGSTVTGARLWLRLSSTSAGPASVNLHRVVADWGEGSSTSGGGGGAPAAPGDSTWLHRFFDAVLWTQPGGDFDPNPRAEAIVDQPGPYTWGSTPEMVADVQSWLDHPASAFGWILLGDETRPQTVKRFDSREFPEEASQPFLEVDFVPLCSPDPVGPGHWKRQCSSVSGGGVTRGPEETDFDERVVPCAQRLLSDLGLPEIVACDAVLSQPPRDCMTRAAGKLAVLVLNVCAGRLQTSCPTDSIEGGCSATTVGELLLEMSVLMQDGDCRRASGCGGSPD